MTDPQTRHNRGLLIVITLGVLFFTLVAMIVLRTGRDNPQPVVTRETVTVLPQRVRIRTEPNARAPVVATAAAGETLLLVEDRGTWVRVQKEDGLSGWAERSSLERTAERERRLGRYAAIRRLPALTGEVTRRTTLYAGPGIFYPVVGEITTGTTAKVYTRDNDFYAIDHEGAVAYADVDSIDVTASGAPQLVVGAEETSTAGTATDTTGTVPPETASVEPPPIEPPPAPAPEPEAPSDFARVYAAVPPGGTQPEEVDRVVPYYPPAARRAGTEGAVVIRGIVRRDGRIDDVEIIRDLPNGLGDSARDAVRRWRFRPATYRGEPIDVYYTVTVNFRLR